MYPTTPTFRVSRRAWLWVGLMLCLLLPATVFAQGQNGGVFYGYAQVQFGDAPVPVLVPRVYNRPLTGDLETDVRALFNTVRNANRPTYGRSGIEVDPKKLKQGAGVTIKVDPAKVAYQVVIEAEVLATLAPLGLKEVTFEGQGKRTLKTDQIPFVVYDAVLPVWAALPPASVPFGIVRMPGSGVVSLEWFNEQLDNPGPTFNRNVLNALRNGDPFSQAQMLGKLPKTKIEDWDDIAVTLITKGVTPEVQEAAVLAFDGTKDREVLDALAKTVEDGKADPKVIAASIKVLGDSGINKYADEGDAQELKNTDSAKALAKIDEVVKAKKNSAPIRDALVANLSGHADVNVAKRSALALRELEFDRALVKALQKEGIKPPVYDELAYQATQLKDKAKAFEGYAALAAKGSPERALPALKTLVTYKDPEPAKAIAKGLDNPNAEVRFAAADTLVETKDADALKVMAKAAQAHPDDAAHIEDAMVELMVASESADDLKELTKFTRDGFERRTIYHALGVRAKRGKVFNRYKDKFTERGFKDKNALAKGGAILGLAAGANQDDLLLIAPFAKDGNPQLRRDVARALAYYPAGQGTDILAELTRDKDLSVTVAAVRAAGKRREDVMIQDVIKMLQKRKEPALIEAVAAALPQMVTPEKKSDVIGALGGLLFNDDMTVKLATLKALGEFSDGTAVDSIAVLVQDQDKGLRQAALQALGATGHAKAVPLINKYGLASDDPETRIQALRAVQKHGDPTFKGEIKKMMGKEKDAGVKAIAEEVLNGMKG